jgi:hypothetical protein
MGGTRSLDLVMAIAITDPLLPRLPARSLVRSVVPALPACPPARLPCRIDACLHLPMQECLHASLPAHLAAAAGCSHTQTRSFASPRPLPCSLLLRLRSLAIAPIMACSCAWHTHSSSHPITSHHHIAALTTHRAHLAHLAPSLPAAALACFGSPPGPPSLCSATSLTLPPTLPVAEHPASLTPQPPTAACVAPTALTTAWLLKTILRVTSVHPRIKPAWPPPLGPWSDKSPVPPVYQLQSSVLMPDLAEQPSPSGFAFSSARNTTAVGRIACFAATDSTSANG